MAKNERRLVPIVSLDVDGYSRLTMLDEGVTLSAVQHVFKERVEATIAGHGGSVFKTMGDGILAEFASVVAAVEWRTCSNSFTSFRWRRRTAKHCNCAPGLSWLMSWCRASTALARG